MGGKKYPKKDKTSSEGSASTQQSSTSSSSAGPPPQRQGPSIRQQLQQMAVSGQQTQPQSRPQQPQGGQQQQQRPQQQQPQSRPQQPQGGQQQQQRSQQQQPQSRPQQPQGGQQQQQRSQQQQPQSRPQQPQGGQQQRSQQQAQSRPQQSQGGQQQLRPRQDQGQGQGQRQGQRQQGGMSRAESMQSIQSEKSAGSGGSGARKPQERPPQLTMDDLKKKGIEGLSVKYKGFGTKGKKLPDIETNYLRLIMQNLVENAYHYDVKIEPDKPKKMLTTVFLKFVEINFPRASIAFDGTNNAYASQRLKIGNLEREITILHPETGRERKYTVAIMEANDSEIPIRRLMTSYQRTTLNEDPKRAMQAMEVILKSAFHQPHLRNGVLGGRSFFLPPDRREYLGDFYELWLGLFQSMVLGNVPYLNVDVNHKAFPKRYPSLVDLLNDMGVDSNRGLDRNVEYALRQHLKGLEIRYNKPNDKAMIYKFMDIVGPPGNVRFTLENGQQKTILQYFQETGRNIRNVNLPCIKLGNTIKNIIVPMEMCGIPDTQVINKKCTENQTRNIIRFAATSTDDRKQKIMKLLSQIRHNNSQTIQGFGLGVDANFAKVPARLLDPPVIEYSNKTMKPSRGVWRGENSAFLLPQAANEWSILNTNFRTKPNELKDLAKMLYNTSRATGLQLAEHPSDIRTISDRETNKIKQEMERLGKENRIKILFVIIPDSGPTYSQIKKMAEIDYGVLTQCIKGGTVSRKRNDMSTISNILLKVNAKLNGTNHKLSSNVINMLSKEKCMFIGADVTHPSPDQTRIPSVVGVASSFDDNAFCYKFDWRLQGQRVEMIQEFREIIKDHLKYYKEKNRGVLPSKIFYYRDGVSEGQFDQVMAIERNAMLQACRDMEPGYEKRVKMTVVVVQKRHHTRFFPGNTGVGKDDRKNNNVPAGTIVDTVITRPNENHFYLVSHQSIQGVAKPTKYCILLDEGNHSIDDLQCLTYDLCHLFTRCNRAVSYPAPTYYAHLAAYRGRVYIENEPLNMNNLAREWSMRAIKDNIINGRPMFFV
ncbi:protein argonaute-2-like [Sitodiplosis mosellana]|uniref:protein argonaute-2-like n=1 Tax=Sitodiplosis mosellana TaxID=263140 RepID=UPI00244438A6|nr:protein argonaute-2-like [Sitodiplosis mosellana]